MMENYANSTVTFLEAGLAPILHCIFSMARKVRFVLLSLFQSAIIPLFHGMTMDTVLFVQRLAGCRLAPCEAMAFARRRYFWRGIMFCLMVSLLGVACSNRRGPTDNGLTNAGEALPPGSVFAEGMLGLDAEEDSGDSHSVVIRQGLVLNVRVEVQGRWEVDEKAIRVTSAGGIHLPLIGSVAAGGLTLNAFRDRVEQQYAEYYVKPRVTVDFVADEGRNIFPWGSVTVLGRVQKPGVVPLPPTQVLSVVAAIQAAGGFDTSADQRSIRVTGRDEQTRRVNLRALGRTGQSTENPLLREGDVVYVPEQFF